MDIEAFAAVNQPQWQRLHQLAARRRLNADEADELLHLYQRASTHLSMIQAVEQDSPVAASLSATIARARAHLTGAGENVFTSLGQFFTQTLPVAFYRLRWLTVIIGAAFVALGVASGVWAYHHPQLDLLMPESARIAYAEHDFVNYYSEHPNSSFAAQVWTNNAWVAAHCVAFGVTGIWPIAILLLNAQGVGVAGGVMAEQGRMADFWLYILPHGLMELTAVFVAAAAGLRIFYSWVAPGQKPRVMSLAQEARRLITVVLGLTVVLFISGLVEGFVTPSNLPYWLKITIGALVLAAFWTYTLVLGRRAHQAGLTGDLNRYDAGTHHLTA
ncbi:stage II sporulation protein M [Nesterenkonia flava]|uniref:Stage II sporulation protein M n=1 Tax=Nesterenkonia flava TaxID=469799 RepID=A0ABU1FQ63_9MICC|nr:stage II sporulation protein M [Nesterenkonia flava]MDR5710781.1 stage II sporulation protein M [Nesterenkonia flava]